MINIDLTHLFPPSLPSWMLCRWDKRNYDLSDVERDEVKKAGITDFDDFGIGISYNRIDDAKLIAQRMADRLSIRFGVIDDNCVCLFVVEPKKNPD